MEERPGSGRTHGTRCFSGNSCQYPQRIHIGMFSLARPHANCGESLQQFNVVKAFLDSIREVLILQIFIKINKVFACGMVDEGIGVRGGFWGM